MKCRRCREPAVIDVPRHNAGFCADCFTRHCREQVRRAIEDHDMIAPGDRVLVAVSGGKDSLGLWQLLRELGYDADGLYVGLGIGEYSDRSGEYARAFAERHGWPLLEVDLRTTYGFDVPTGRRRSGGRRARRAGCRSATCSTTPRSRTATTCSRPATTSTTRPRCCSATCCAGTRAISAASTRCFPRRRASCAR